MNHDRVSELYFGQIMTKQSQEACRDRIHWMVDRAHGRKLLDIGCSQGIASILAARRGLEVLGVDLNPASIDYARALLEREPEDVQRRVRFVVGDATRGAAGDESFDTVFLGEVLEHQKQPETILQCARDRLAQGGLLVATVPFGYHPHDDHWTTFYLSNLVSVLDGVLAPISLDVHGDYVRLVASRIGDPDHAAMDLDPAQLLAMSEVGFLAKEREHQDVSSDRLRRLKAMTERDALRARQAIADGHEQRRLANEVRRRNKRIEDLEAKVVTLKNRIKQLSRDLKKAARLPPILPPPPDSGAFSRAVAMLLGSMQHEVHTGRALKRPHTALFKTYGRVVKAVRNQPLLPKAPVVAESPSRAEENVEEVAPPAPPSLPALAPFSPRVGERHSSLVVASILDPFSEACFRYDASLVPLSPANWAQEIADHQPAFLLAESAWAGNAGQWQYMMSQYRKREDNPLRALLAHCRDIGLPTVFWNKEDPPNFDVFKDVAVEFDYIFTTDANCIPRYRELVGHDRVYALPFAAQPAIHNPIQDGIDRNGSVCFAGSWRADKYPERAADSETLLKPALDYGLTIFDRYAGTKHAETFAFPEPYKRAVRGSLDYETTLSAYRSFKAFINVNSVKDSPTMFARRVFELMACGTPVISSDSQGIREMLGRLVKIADSEDEARKHLKSLLEDDDLRERFAHVGYREILSRHTYRHRLATVTRELGLEYRANSEPPLVTILAASNRPERLDNLLANVRRQVHPRVQLLLVLNSDQYRSEVVEAASGDLPDVKILRLPEEAYLADCLNLGIEHATGAWVAKFDDDDYYGPHYLSDLLLARSYTSAAILGKRSYFCYFEGSDEMALRFPGQSHRHGEFVHGGTLLVERSVFDSVQFTAVQQGTDTIFLHECRARGFEIYSADPYNFVHVRHPSMTDHTWQISDDDMLSKCRLLGPGLDMTRVMI